MTTVSEETKGKTPVGTSTAGHIIVWGNFSQEKSGNSI